MQYIKLTPSTIVFLFSVMSRVCWKWLSLIAPFHKCGHEKRCVYIYIYRYIGHLPCVFVATREAIASQFLSLYRWCLFRHVAGRRQEDLRCAACQAQETFFFPKMFRLKKCRIPKKIDFQHLGIPKKKCGYVSLDFKEK